MNAYEVTTQSTKRNVFNVRQGWHPVERWAYVIHAPGFYPFVSDYRYSTEGSARRHGEADAEAVRKGREES